MIAIVDNIYRLLFVLLNDLTILVSIILINRGSFPTVVHRRFGFGVASLELARVSRAAPVVHHGLLAEVAERLLWTLGGRVLISLLMLVLEWDLVDGRLVDVGMHTGLARLLVLEIVAGYALFVRLNMLDVLRAEQVSVFLVMLLKVLGRAHLVSGVLVLSGGFGDFGRLQVL